MYVESQIAGRERLATLRRLPSSATARCDVWRTRLAACGPCSLLWAVWASTTARASSAVVLTVGDAPRSRQPRSAPNATADSSFKPEPSEGAPASTRTL